MSRPVGRPKKSRGQLRNIRFTLSATPSEADRIERTARASKHGTAIAWIRDVILSQANAITGGR
jgi:hypothetical protein